MTTFRRQPYVRQKLALIISNGNYIYQDNKLSDSDKNAAELSNLLTKIGFSVTKLHNLKKRNMVTSVNEFCNSIKDGDLILFYFSGFGYQFENENYLIPIEHENPENSLDVADNSIKVDGIIKRLTKENPSYATIVILDCYRPYMLRNARVSTVQDENNGLQKIEPPTNVFIQFACNANQTITNTRIINRNNLFFKYLIRHISKENVDVTKVFNSIVKDVYSESDRYQKPLTMNGLDRNGNVYLNEIKTIVPEIPENAYWISNGHTVAGGHGPDNAFKRLNCPKGIALDRKQALLIADNLNHRIMKYNRNANVGRRIAGKNIDGYAPDRLYGPSDVIFHIQSKSFIICDYHNRRVLKWYYRSKTYEVIIKANVACYGLAIDDEGSIYVSDTERHEVSRYGFNDRIGKVVAGGNGQGRRLHQLNHPTYICVGTDFAVYVSDSWNDRVMKWSKDADKGVIVAGGNGKGGDRHQLDCPTGVLVDRRDTIYVADHWNHRVMRWKKGAQRGEKIAGSLRPGKKNNQLNGPEGLAFDKFGNLYVADSNNHRIQLFDIESE